MPSPPPQVDSHTMLIDQWDTLLMEDWKKTENEYAAATPLVERCRCHPQDTAGMIRLTSRVLSCQARTHSHLPSVIIVQL
jgi:hypothetical protein